MKRLIFALARCSIFITWTINLTAFWLTALWMFPTRFGALPYTSLTGKIGATPAATWPTDHSLNFWIRLILDGQYDFMIEIGALTADRAIAVAKRFPQLQVFALDITGDYQSDKRIVDNLTLALNSLDNIRRFAGLGRRGLLCSHGTMSGYSDDDLRELLTCARDLKLDIALVEPNTIGDQSLTQSLPRTSITRYHPYLALLRKRGYELPFGNGVVAADAYSTYAETYTYIFARLTAS